MVRWFRYQGGRLAVRVTSSRSNLSMNCWLVLYHVFRIVIMWYCVGCRSGQVREKGQKGWWG